MNEVVVQRHPIGVKRADGAGFTMPRMMDEAYSAAYQPPERGHDYERMSRAPKGAGWIMYAGIVIVIAGVLNVIYGLSAISSSKFFEQHANYIFSSLKTWGWVMLLLGLLQVMAAFAIWSEQRWGRWLGIATAALNAIAQLMFLPAAPLAALAVFTADMLVLYGLLRYGDVRTA